MSKPQHKRHYVKQQCIYCLNHLNPVEEHSGEIVCSRCRKWEDERDNLNMSNGEYSRYLREKRRAGQKEKTVG